MIQAKQNTLCDSHTLRPSEQGIVSGIALPSSAMNTLHMNLPTGRDKEVWTENVGVPLLRRSEASEDWAEACTNPADPMNAANTLQSTGPWGLGVL